MNKRILLLVHKDLIPDKSIVPDRYTSPWVTEYDVLTTLEKLGYEVKVLGLIHDIQKLIAEINQFKPYCVFNLLEEFNFDTQSDYKVLALLDMMGIKYTGCNPKGLLLARDKAISKKILKHHRIGTPKFFTMPRRKKGKVPARINYPLIVKCLFEEASLGIAKASIVHSEEKLFERVNYIHEKLEEDAIVEEFIPGKEIYVGVLGNIKLSNLPLWELRFENVENPDKEIYSEQAKWNKKYRKRKGIHSQVADLPPKVEKKIVSAVKNTYRALNLSGYARIDLRLTEDNRIYILEANPNPNIAKDDEFAESAKAVGIKYEDLIEKLLP